MRPVLNPEQLNRIQKALPIPTSLHVPGYWERCPGWHICRVYKALTITNFL